MPKNTVNTAEPLVLESSACEFGIITEKLRYTDHQVLIQFQHN
jgi:hypothetical protein